MLQSHTRKVGATSKIKNGLRVFTQFCVWTGCLGWSRTRRRYANHKFYGHTFCISSSPPWIRTLISAIRPSRNPLRFNEAHCFSRRFSNSIIIRKSGLSQMAFETARKHGCSFKHTKQAFQLSPKWIHEKQLLVSLFNCSGQKRIVVFFVAVTIVQKVRTMSSLLKAKLEYYACAISPKSTCNYLYKGGLNPDADVLILSLVLRVANSWSRHHLLNQYICSMKSLSSMARKW